MTRTVEGARADQDAGVQVGLLVASALAPETFTPSLSARSAVDQGVVTGLGAGLHYVLTLGSYDALHAVAAQLSVTAGQRGLRRADVVADLVAVPLGVAVARVMPVRAGESALRGGLRQAGWRLAVAGTGGLLLAATRTGLRRVDGFVGSGGALAAFPVAVPIGLAVAYVLRRRQAGLADDAPVPTAETPAPPPGKALFTAGGVVGGLSAVAYAEHAMAGMLGRQLASALPGGIRLWRLTTHAVLLGAVVAGTSLVWDRAMQGVEASTEADQPVLGEDEGERWTGPTISGGPGSLVPWRTLGREGRRHALAYARPHPVEDRPPGLPDLSIETVMGEPARAAPIQVYVGLDSAESPQERVRLALAELERTGAFDRSLLLLVSPTGTGYVNYVALAATQYLSRGDVASVALQYSKRPSPLSLGMVDAAREQNRLLWLSILDRLHHRSGPRPRVVLFGESLGAHTSQDVFLHWGTLGPQALGIDRALWIGTPYGSKWMHQVTGSGRLDTDQDTVAVVNDFAQLEALGAARRSRLRFVLVSHDNDGVTKFGPDLLVTPPPWLRPDRSPMEHIEGASPRGIPARMRWRPLTTFFQTLVDMKNAQLPGGYRAWGHDYRPDLPRFVREVFDLPASDTQMAAVEAAIRRREELRERLFDSSARTADPADRT
ncbi:MAG TPA: alpha/beta-hydrolase family protein [Jiangellales bacterium]|nr:alpha/beta-hydrolase family protein [Jiangellales bacterium]